MKKSFAFLLVVILLSSCAPTSAQIEKAIGETQTAIAESFTNTPVQTNTPLATKTPKPTNTPKPTATPQLGTFSNPFPFGDIAYLEMTSAGEVTEFIVKIEEILRGDAAWSVIRQANSFNDAPPTGYEALLVKIYIKNTSSSGFLTIDKYELNLSTLGNLISYTTYSPCCLNNAGFVEFDVKLNPQGEFFGWYASAVRIGDESPALVIGADYDGRGGLYFALTDN
jgi:hypothetical protein